MPELPEVHAHAERLHAVLAGALLERVEPLTFTSLKTFSPAADAAVGRPVESVRRRGKFLLFGLGPITHVVHLMQGGRLRPDARRSPRPKNGLFRWVFAEQGAYLLTEAGTERKAGVWVLEGDPQGQPPLDGLGPDADTVDVDVVRDLLNSNSMRLHRLLREQSKIAGLGRRLANEVCFRARLSPFVPVSGLGEADALQLVVAIREALADGLTEERKRSDMSSSAERRSLVHNRAGQECPVCGDVVRDVEYRTYTIYYCSTCQTGGKVLADNRMSKFGVRDASPREGDAEAR